MKKYLLFFAAVILSLSLSAQHSFIGTWTGKTVKNGQPMGFKLNMYKDGSFSMAYDLNPNDLSYKGSWSHSNGTLTFKGSDEELQLRKMPKGVNAGKKSFAMQFSHGGKSVIYGFNIGMPPTLTKLFGWDKGVASVSVGRL